MDVAIARNKMYPIEPLIYIAVPIQAWAAMSGVYLLFGWDIQKYCVIISIIAGAYLALLCIKQRQTNKIMAFIMAKEENKQNLELQTKEDNNSNNTIPMDNI